MSLFSRLCGGKETSESAPAHRRPLGEEYWAESPVRPQAGVLRELLSAWVDREVSRRLTNLREMLLEPNRGSSIKIERYSFGIHTTITLGVAKAPLTLTGQPDVKIRPQRVIMNAPSPGFAIIDEIKVANVSVTAGVQEDAFNYSSLAHGVHLDMPTLSPANRATVLGEMTGRVPEGFGFKNPTGPGWVDEGADEVSPPATPEATPEGGEVGAFLEAQKPKVNKRNLGESYLFTCAFQGPATVIA